MFDFFIELTMMLKNSRFDDERLRDEKTTAYLD